MTRRLFSFRPAHIGNCFSLIAVLSLLAFSPVHAQKSDELIATGYFPRSTNSAKLIPAPNSPSPVPNESKVPSGTILPIVLRTSFSFDKCRPGQILRGEIAQDVPLPNGSKIRKGSTVEGHIVEVTTATAANPAKVSIQFDKLFLAGQWFPVVTNLRAIAGFMTVLEASVPDEAPSEGTSYNWLPTTQIGGDSVYGVNGGPVMSAENASQLVGKSVGDGVLARVRAKAGANCRGAINGNDNPQALWVFSTDACGVYGIDHLMIAHAGRTAPEGIIVLTSETSNVKLRSGDGLLLRLD
jgi:hypothetical protein